MPFWYQQCRAAIMVLHATVGVGVFGYALNRRKGFVWRLPVAVALAMLIAYFASANIYTFGITPRAVLSQATVQILVYCLVLEIVHFCLEESFWTAMYVTTSGMAAQGLAGCLKTIVKLIPFMNSLAMHDIGIIPLDVLCYGGVFAAVFYIFRSYTSVRLEAAGNRAKAIVSTVILVFYLANTWLMRDYSDGNLKIYVVATNVYAILVQFLIFMVQFNVMERGRLSQDIETIRELMHEQRAQYEASRESVQLINEKYHDLKHLMNSLQTTLPREELDRLSETIASYDVRVQTGFEVLDVVLAEKMSLCVQRDITMTCNIGQVDFTFLDEMDLYSLFSNALTNAVNAVCAIPKEGSRYIVLSVSQEGNIVAIHIENPCQESLTFIDGIPQTSGDPGWHGFGMKSMVRTAEKYGGALSASQENGRFQLDIILLNLSAE